MTRASLQTTRTWSTVLALAALALMLVGAAVAGGKTFVSKRYGYSLTLPWNPAPWLITPATTSWTGSPPNLASPSFDILTYGLSGRTYLIASRQLPARTTLEQWTAMLVAITPPGCRPERTSSRSTLGGVKARVFRVSCPTEMLTAFDVAAIHRHRGYFFIAVSQTTTSKASSRRVFDDARRGFRFREA